jgi:hypothetical protein
MKKSGIPGLAVGVVQSNSTAYLRGFGISGPSVRLCTAPAVNAGVNSTSVGNKPKKTVLMILLIFMFPAGPAPLSGTSFAPSFD